MKYRLGGLGFWVLFGALLPAEAWAGPQSVRRQLANAGPSASAAEIPALAQLLDKAGWTPTPELSGVFKVGSIFQDEGDGHALMVRDCFERPTGSDTYTSVELVTQLQGGVKVRAGLVSARASGGLVKKVKFGAPVHHTIERLAMEPTPSCRQMLAKVSKGDLQTMYAVQEVLTAEIAEQTCGRVDAKGNFVGLGKAEAELSRACMQESLEPVAVAYRVVSLAELGVSGVSRSLAPIARVRHETSADCPWGAIETVSTTMSTLTINGKTVDVRGQEQRSALIDTMQRCGRPEAARAFEAWRARRRTTNVSCATVFGCWPFGIGLVSAVQAKNKRQQFEVLLIDPASLD